MALLEQENALETGEVDLRPDPAYFAFEFYPYHPQCSAAASQGRQIWKCYQAVGEELACLYWDYALRLNKARILASSETYESVMSRFRGSAEENRPPARAKGIRVRPVTTCE